MPENGKETNMDKNIFYRSIPKVDILLEDERIQNAASIYERDTVMDAIREQAEYVRGLIRTCDEEETIRRGIDNLIPDIIRRVEKMHTPDMRPVINATGTILHTNLGAYGKACGSSMRILQSGV